MAYLVWDSPRGRVVREIDRSVLIVGRDEVSDLRIDHGSVSARHALVQVETDGAVRITDLGSQNGTRINGAALVPDLPSTLEPGDFIHLGKVVLTFHKMPPPPLPEAPKRQASPARARTSVPAGDAATTPWKWIALGLAFVLVGCLGALIALAVARNGDDRDAPERKESDAEHAKRPEGAPAATPGGADGQDRSGDARTSPPQGKADAEPEAKPLPVIEEAPPARYASVAACPDLLEMRDGTFAPAKVLTWDRSNIEVIGCDGRRHRFARSEVDKIVDRADLARRSSQRIAKQSVDDDLGCFKLAKWCFERHVREPLKPFLKRVLALRPGDPAGKYLESIEADEEGADGRGSG